MTVAVGPGYAAELRSREEELRQARQPFALATVVRARRPTSAKAGDRALVLPDGTIEGFVGGSCAQASVRLHGLRVLAAGEPVILRIIPAEEMPGDLASGLAPGSPGLAPAASPEASSPEPSSPAASPEGLVTVANPCESGGMLEIFLEAELPPPLVLVHGEGPAAQAVRDVGSALGYDVRPDSAAPALPTGTAPTGTAPTGTAPTGTAALPPDTAAVVVASHGRDEGPVLEAALAAGIPYVGLIASRRRGASVLASLDVADPALLDRVHTPAGLDIGARTPQEIALSIFAEMIAERPRRTAPPPGASAPAAEQAGSSPAAAAEPATATDPVCGMSVAVADATPRITRDGVTWFFCGPGCRQAFAAEPARYSSP